MILKTFKQFLLEAESSQLTSIKAGEDSKVEVSDQKTVDGEVIPAQEILGQIITADTEDAFKAYFYDKYGSTKFDTATMGQMLTAYQDYYAEEAEEEKEKETETEGGEGEDDPLADIDV